MSTDALDQHFGRTLETSTQPLDEHFGRHEKRFDLLKRSIDAGAFDQAKILADLLMEVDEYRERVEKLMDLLPARAKK